MKYTSPQVKICEETLTLSICFYVIPLFIICYLTLENKLFLHFQAFLSENTNHLGVFTMKYMKWSKQHTLYH